MKKITITLYKFDELSEEAQKRVLWTVPKIRGYKENDYKELFREDEYWFSEDGVKFDY